MNRQGSPKTPLKRARFRVLWLLCSVIIIATGGCALILQPEDGEQPPADIAELPMEGEQPEENLEPEPEPEPQPPPPRPAPRYSIQGYVDLVADNAALLAGSSLQQAVIYYQPEGGASPPDPGSFQVETIDKVFEPTVLVVPVGSEVSFLNQDDILHNVFSVSAGATFDLGYYGNGEARSYVFDQPGRVLVNCSVHDTMSADILVMDTPFYTRPDADGAFQLNDLPAGSGELKIWHPQASLSSYPLSVPVATEVGYQIRLTKPRIVPGSGQAGGTPFP